MLYSTEGFDAVIVANGSFPVRQEAIQIMAKARILVACDGAVHALEANGFSPDFIVGDGDSLTKEDKTRLGKRLVIVDEQEDNDLTKATRHCIALGCSRIAYIAATGLREDHTLGNIALMERYHRVFNISPVMITDHGIITACQGNRTLDATPHQQVSLFNFSCSQLSSTNLKWDAYAYKELWQGTLNEALSDSFSIKADGYYLVYQTFDIKQPE